MPAIVAFEEWLKKSNYRESTARSTVRKINAAEAAFDSDEQLPDSSRDAARRYMAFAKANNYEDEFTAWLASEGTQAVTKKLSPKPKRRKLEARSFTEDDWIKIRSYVAQSGDHRDAIIYVLSVTGLRIGDILRVPFNDIDRALKSNSIELERKGGTFIEVAVGVKEPWERLHTLMKEIKPRPKTVAEFLTPKNPRTDSDGGAYKQISRRLKQLGETLDLEGRVHLHRIRRTVAVRALEASGDMKAVQEMLGHASMASTQKYTDEKRINKVADLQRKLAGV